MSVIACSIEECQSLPVARSWCKKHYTRWERHGDPRYTKYVERDADIEEILLQNVDASGVCWIWTGSISSTGYGNVTFKGKQGNAHKVTYEALVGAVGVDLQLDHLCRVRACVNPDHLEPVTPAINSRRASGIAGDRCRVGHSDWYLWNGYRLCRPCRTEANRRYVARRRGLS